MPSSFSRRGLLALLGLAALVRLFVAYIWLPGGGFPSDLGTFTSWGLQLADHGSATFYANAGFADYPPGYLYVLWVLGLVAHLSADAVGAMGALLKLPAMGADIAIGALLAFIVARARAGKPDAGRLALLAAGLYLFNPLTIYDSALWGQVDAVGLLVMLGCAWALMAGAIEIALPAAMLAALVKPQFGLVLAPIVIVLMVRRHLLRPGSGPQPAGLLAFLGGRPDWLRVLIGLGAAAVTYFVLALPFGLSPVGMVDLLSKTTSTYPYLTVNAYNPWALIGTGGASSFASGGGWLPDSAPFIFGLSAFAVGTILLFAGLALSALVVAYRDDRRALLLGLTIAALAFFVLPTRVHERYLFPVTALLPLLAITSRRYLVMGAVLSLAALANFHGVLLSYAQDATAALPGGELARDPLVITFAALLSLGVLLIVILDSDPLRALLGARMRAIGWPLSPQPDPLTGPSILAVSTPVSSAPVTGRKVARASTATSARSRVARPAAATRRAWPRLLASLAWYHKVPIRLAAPERLGRRDAVLAVVIMILAFTTRFIGVGQPATMYFDEVYHARTATEFLQDWRYGIPHDIYEYTHPHLAKYAMALGIITFGGNEVTATDTLSAARAAVVEPRYEDPADPSVQHGERLYLATGTSIEVYALPDRSHLASLSFPAVQLALDTAGHRLFASDAAGHLGVLDDTAALEPDALDIHPVLTTLATLPSPTSRLAATQNGVFALLGDTRLLRLDATSGAVAVERTLTAPVNTFVALPGDRLAFAGADGSLAIVGADLVTISTIKLTAPATALAYVAIDSGKIYATTSAGLETSPLGAKGSLGTVTLEAMPGAVRALAFNPSSELLHVLGRSQDGSADTVYVVEPRGNAVFADARLPFSADLLLVDATPDYPASDPQQVLALATNGDLAVVAAGGNATAWRLPGVLAGTVLLLALFFLARLLLRRRAAALAVVSFALLDGMFFASARIAMNDIYVTTFIVAAYALFAALWLGRWRGRAAAILGLPSVGLLLGLALASKWVGLYAIGGVALLILARTRIGRWLLLAGLVLITSTLGLISFSEGNFLFALVMLGLTAASTVIIARRGPDLDPENGLPAWIRPGPGWIWTALCLLIVPVVVYAASYAPWVALGNQWFGGFPTGHTGQTLADLTASMYNYHDQLRDTHAAGSPWWAWPLDLKPVWFASTGVANSLSQQIYDAGNLVVFWMAIPALVWAAGAARRRRDLGLAFIVIAFAAAWLPWARIDRVTFEYHYFSALPFAVLALGALAGELWGRRPSSFAFLAAKLGVAGALCLPALLWVARGPLCVVSGANDVTAAASACGPTANVSLALLAMATAALASMIVATRLSVGWRQMALLGVGSLLLLGVALNAPHATSFIPALAALVGSGLLASFVLALRDPRRLLGGIVVAIVAVAVLSYPFVAAVPVPGNASDLWGKVLPTFDYYFQFASDTAVSPPAPGLAMMAIITILVALNVVGLVRLARNRAED